MSRKIISLFAVCMAVVCLALAPVWGEDKPQANDNSTQPSVWTQLKEGATSGVKVEVRQDWNAPQSVQGAAPAGIPKRDAASPQDFCGFTAACFDGPLAPPCATPFFPGGELTEYQDPALTCPPVNCAGVYPFEVTSVTILLSNCDPSNPVGMLLTPIVRADTGGPLCNIPGPVLCSGQPIQFTIPPNTFCQPFQLPLPPGCCVSGPYFAGVDIQILPGPPPNITPCWDLTDAPCCSYYDFMSPGFFGDLISFGGVGNLAIWSDGFLECQNDCGDKNHYKTWRLQPPLPLTGVYQVKDQFMFDNVAINGLEFLSNPTQKVHGLDTFDIVKPNNHLDWYRMFGRDTLLAVTYQNQFESTTVLIDTAQYLLIPAQKLPHPPTDSLDHYKCYRIRVPKLFNAPIRLDDQFDQIPENITSLTQLYFCTPCQKNNDPLYDTTTHYVAYKFPPQPYSGPPTWQVIDQVPPNIHNVNPINSEMLLVPTRKLAFTTCSNPTAPLEGDASGNLMLQLNDAVAIVNAVFNKLPGRPPCLANDATCWYGGITCRGDWSGNGVVALNDAIQAINYAFSKIPGCVGAPPCCWKPIKTLPCCHDLPAPCGP